MTACECGKVRYFSRKEAKRSARTFLGGGHKGKLRAYRCDDSGFWHLTSESTAKATAYREHARRVARP